MNWKKILKGIDTVANAGNTFNSMKGNESTYGKVMDKLAGLPSITGVGEAGRFVARSLVNYAGVTSNENEQKRKGQEQLANLPPIPKRTQERHELTQPQNYSVNQSSWNRVQQTANNSLASQVKTQTSEPIKNLTQTEQAEQVQEQMDKKRGEEKKWYQKLAKTPQAFKDGYQFGDVSQTIGQTALDIGGSVIGGFESAGQGAGNLIAGIASPFVAQAYSDITGTDYGKTLKAWEKSIGQEHSIYDKYIEPNIRKDSAVGETLENALEGIGYTLASAGVGQALGTAGEISALGGKLNMPVFSFVSGAGNSLQEGFSKEDYNRAMVWLNAGGEGTIEAFTEGIFGLFGVGGNEITDTLKANVMKKCSTGLGKAVANVGLSGAGEGAEEVLGYIMTFGLHNFEAYAERALGLGDGSNYAEAFDSEEMWESFWSSMISTAISMGMAEYSNVDARTAQTLNYCEEQLGRELTDKEVRNISREVLKQTESDVEQSLLGEGILNDIQTNEKLSQDQKQFLIEQRQLNLWTDEETKNEINEIVKINENIAKNQPATMANEAISGEEQQTISNKQKQAQNVTSNDIEQNAKNTLQNNVILEEKNGKQVYKERNTVEITKDDNLESSYKKYFGDNETSLFKNLKNIEKVAKDIATNVVYDANLFKDKDGSINTKAEALFRTNNGQREIVVNPYADTGKAFERIVAHELTHSVLGNNTKEAKQLMQTVENFWKNKYGQKGYNNIVSELREAYGENYNEEEVTAKTIEQLFTTEEALDELANSNPNIFTRIYRSLVGMYAKLTGNEKAYLKKLKLDMELAWDKSRNKEKLKDAVEKYSEQLETDNSNEYQMVTNGEKEYYRKKIREFKDNDGHTFVIYEKPNKHNELEIKTEGEKGSEIITGSRNDILVKIREYWKGQGTFTEIENNESKYSQETSVDNELELSNTDSQGRELTKEQQEYFKESKARDENGNLLEVYHGTSNDFTQFDMSYLGSASGDLGYLGDGFYVATHKGEANYYGNKVMSGYINIKNPFNIGTLTEYNGKKLSGENTTVGLEIKNVVELNKQWENLEINDTTYGEIAKATDDFLKNAKIENLGIVEDYDGNDSGIMWGITYNGKTKEVESILNYSEDEMRADALNDFIREEFGYIRGSDILQNITRANMLDKNIKSFREILEEKGYDSILQDTPQTTDEIVLFNSNQFKNIDNKKPTTDPDIRYSIETEEFDRILSENFPEPATEDNNGEKLAKGMADFMNNSKARSLKNGGLVNVFHTTTGTTPQFNEFNPVGTPGYKFGNQVVNYYTDDKEMSGSYANQKYKMANTQKLQSMSDVDNFIDSINNNSKSGNEYFISENDGKYTLILTDSEIGENVSEFFKNLSEEEKQELKDNIYHDTDLAGTPYEFAFSWDKFSPKLQKKYNDLMDKYVGDEKLVDAEKRLYEMATGQKANNEIATYDSQEELFKHLQEDLQKNNWTDNTKIQYSGYVNIQNPYVVDAKGRNWNLIDYESNEELDEVINTINTISDDTYNSIIDIYNNEIGKVNNAERKVNEMQSFISTHKDSKFIDEISKITILETIDQSKALKKNKDLTEENTTFSSKETIKKIAGTEDLSKALEYINKKLKEDSGYNGLTIGQFIEEQRDAILMSRSRYGSAGNFEESLETFFENNPEEQERFQYLDSEMGYDGDFNELLSNVLHNGISGEELKQTLETYFIKNLSESSTETNDIVKQVIDYNNSLFEDYKETKSKAEELGIDLLDASKNRTQEEILMMGGYDGVIIRNTTDYGGKAKKRAPHDLYITFGSNQFKAKDNKNPTKDKDIRYSKDTTGDWGNYLTKYAKEGTQTFLPGLKEVMPEKKYSIKDFEDVLKEYQFTDKDKQDLLADLQGIELNKQSLDDFKDFVKQFDENYQESMAMKQDQKEIENNILNTKQTFSTGRKEIYNKYKNDNSNYDKTFINQAKQAVPGNRYGRTKDQWLYVAKTLGNYMANANLTDEQIEKITYRTWLDEAPNQKSNLNRQGEKFVKFNSDDWINAVYNEVNNLRYSMETEKQAPEEEIKLPKKTMNPTEISNLKYEDITTTPNLPEKKYAKGEKTSSFVSNIYNDVDFLNDLQKQDITKDENVRYYKEVTNKKDLENAYKDLQTNGQRATLQWYAKNSKDADSEDVAKGWILLKQYADKGDTQNMINVARKLRDIGTKAGQTVQAFNIMSRLTPEGMVAYTQSELQDAYNEMIKGKTKAWIDQHKADFDLTPEEVAFIMDTMQNLPAENLETHNYERKVALGQIQKLFTDKLPVEKGKIKAWMRISMLFNPKTQVRNVMGNSVVIPVNMFSDFLGSKVDKLLSKYTGVRTLGNTNIKNYLGGMKEGFYQSYNDYKLGINTRDIEQNRFEFGQGKAFKDTGLGKQINRIDNMLNFVMDFGDRGFYQGSFVNSLNNQMLLNGVDTPTQDMIDIATQEALSRTWNDSNDYTRFVLNLRSGLNKLVGGENYGLGDVLIPFAKTPANLTKAIIEYSPVGLAKSIMDIKGIKNAIETGQFTAQQQHEFVDHLGKGLAGSLLYVISYALAKAGVASGEPDDDKDLKNFMRYSLGVTPYSITIGNKSFTYDWAQPIATPLAIMSNLAQYEKNNPDASAIEKVLSSVNIGSNQLLEQSFMQSINEVLNGNGEFTDRLSKAVLDLPARAIPTFSKQVADLVDDTQRTTFERGKPVQSAVNAVIAKIPGASKTLTPSVDTLGNDIKKYGGDNNFFNVFFNPANMNKGQETKAGKEIYDVYMKTGDTTVFPVTAPYYVDRKEGRINMDAETRAKYQKVAGKYTEEAVNKLLSDSSYKALSPDDKAEILSKVVTDSSEKAKKDVLNIDKNGSDLKLIEKVGTDYYTYKISTKGMSKDAELSDVLLNKNYSNKNKQLIYESEINKEDKTYNGLKNIDSNFDMDEYLKYKTQTFSGDNRKDDMVTYINDLNLSRAEQLYIKGRNYKLSNSEKYELESLLEDNPNLEEILDTIK